MNQYRLKGILFGFLPYILTLILLSPSLSADIIYKGVCGSYSYDLNVSNNKYYGAFCDKGRLLVYFDGSGSRDYIRAIYTDPTYNSFDIYSIETGKWYKSFDYNEGDIKNIGVPSFHLLAGLAGLLIGLSFLYVVMRLV